MTGLLNSQKGMIGLTLGLKSFCGFQTPTTQLSAKIAHFVHPQLHLTCFVKLISLDDITMPLLLTVNTKSFICTTLYDGLIILK